MTGLRDIHMCLRCMWGIFISVSFRICSQVWDEYEECLYLCCFPHKGWAKCEEYLYLSCLCKTGLRSQACVNNIHICFIHLGLVWELFLRVWGVYEECVYLFSFPHMCLSPVWAILISPLCTKERSEEYSYRSELCVFYSPKTALRDIHAGMGRVWGILISISFT